MTQNTNLPKLPAASGEIVDGASLEQIRRRLENWFEMFLENPSPSNLELVQHYTAEYQKLYAAIHQEEWVL